MRFLILQHNWFLIYPIFIHWSHKHRTLICRIIFLTLLLNLFTRAELSLAAGMEFDPVITSENRKIIRPKPESAFPTTSNAHENSTLETKQLRDLEKTFLEHHVKGDFLVAEEIARDLFVRAQQQEPPLRAAYATELMALSLIALNRQAEIPSLYESMLKALRQRLGLTHPDIPRLHYNLARFFNISQQTSAAEPHYRATVTLLRQILGEKDPDYARIVMEQAGNLEESGKFMQAESLFREVIAILASHFGNQSAPAGMAWERLALFYEARGRKRDAFEAWRHSKEIVAKLTGAKIVIVERDKPQTGKQKPKRP